MSNRYAWIDNDGLVVCGTCLTEMAGEAGHDPVDALRFRAAGWEKFDDPDEGWCSVCDADLISRPSSRF